MTSERLTALARRIVSDLFCAPDELPHGGTFEEVIERIAGLLATLDAVPLDVEGLRVSPDEIDLALTSLGPPGTKAEAIVFVAAKAASAALRARLASPEPREDALRAALLNLRRKDLDDGPCWCSVTPNPTVGPRHERKCLAARAVLQVKGVSE